MEQPTACDPATITASLLAARGIDDGAQALIDPFCIPDMEAAARRILAAIERQERIGIFGDYDCDGVTSTAQLVRYFARNGVTPVVRLPHRVRDGYGLSMQIVEELVDAGIRLLITVDTGIASSHEIARAADAGMDVIVVDHHHILQAPARAVAVVHPGLSSAFPLPHPSAAGVTLLLLRALEGEDWPDRPTDEALAAIGTIADLVPLTGQNRALVRRGLQALNSLQAGPLADMARRACPSGTVTATDVAFRIAPRLNAAGRMASADIALAALLEGGTHLDALDALNTQRQDVTQQMTAGILATLDAAPALPALISAASPTYPHGIIGLLAGRLTETYGRPSIIATCCDGKGTASLRSTPAYDIAAGLQHCNDLLDTFGGHAQAGGCTFPIDRWEQLTHRLREHVEASVRPDALLPVLALDSTLHLRDVTTTLATAIASLAPFGQGNAEPVFLVPHVTLEGMRRVGGDGQHLQARAGDVKVIGFRMGHLLDTMAGPLDLACRIGIDTWNGRATAQLSLLDVRAATD